MEKTRQDENDQESRKFWTELRQTAEEVASWPAWKRGGYSFRINKSEKSNENSNTVKAAKIRT